MFPKITYEKAIKILGLPFGGDIKSKEKIWRATLFITHYPNPLFNHGKEIEAEKFFNTVPDPKNLKFVLSADLTLPIGGEAIGTAQGVHKFEELKWRLKNSRMFKGLMKKEGV